VQQKVNGYFSSRKSGTGGSRREPQSDRRGGMGATTDYTDYTDGKVNAKVEIKKRTRARREGRFNSKLTKKGQVWGDTATVFHLMRVVEFGATEKPPALSGAAACC
jgi:hypothetical protein